jgi:hypothetical protein
VTVKYLRDQRHLGTVQAIAEQKFPFPSEDAPDLETLVNLPKPRITVGKDGKRDLYPDIVVVRRPGQWLTLMAEVETEDSVNSGSAETDWKPMSRLGDLLLYVPVGCVPEARKLCKKHGIRVKGIRTWRFRPVWGLEVAEA